jgi:hyperosmotically inducible periplasmic protein
MRKHEMIHGKTFRLSTIAATAAMLLSSPAFAEQPEDAWITTKAKTELLTDDVVNGVGIHVDTFDAHVTLHGQVHTAAERAQAERRVRAIKGVVDVRNMLVVVPDAARKATKIDDAAIQQSVQLALANDDGLAGSTIKVKSVNKGVVVLSGTANTLTAHRRAITQARRVEGVQRVASEIKSPNELADSEIWDDGKTTGTPDGLKTSASDTWITTKAKLTLMAAPGISPMTVNVDTEDGVVTLFGTVSTPAGKALAASEISKLDGVKAVSNDLQVVPDVAAAGVAESDDRVTADVRKRIKARPSLSDSSVKVNTAKGVVRLTGTVASQRDRMTALTAARGASGVKSIIDDMTLAEQAS